MDSAVGAVHAMQAPTQKYTASIYCSENELPNELVEGINQLEQALQMRVWMLVHHRNELWPPIYEQFFNQRMGLTSGKPIALLIDSPGGDARTTYKIAKLFVACCGGYYALVPRYAKSAATLLTLGADKIILGTHAELGPLDVQVHDPELEHTISALDHVQTLEQLSTFALRTLDQAVFLTLARSAKTIGSILPLAMNFSCALTRPLMEGIDAVKYTEMSRLLRIGEAYAERLLKHHYEPDISADIAHRLVSDYPEHGFVIDHEEANGLGLNVDMPEGGVAEAFTQLLPYLTSLTVVGTLEEKSDGQIAEGPAG